VQYAVCGQKVGRQNALRAVPLLKVGRLEPSHWDTFRRHCRGEMSYTRRRTGHASQTIVVLPLYGLMALEREMSTPPILSRSMAQFTFTLYPW